MGLTWIDHDTIDNPVEEMSVGKGVAEDVEFTVETLGTGAAAAGTGSVAAGSTASNAAGHGLGGGGGGGTISVAGSSSSVNSGSNNNLSAQGSRRESLISKKVFEECID